MRRVIVVSLCLALSIVGAAAAQAATTAADRAQSSITTGDLSALILQAATGAPDADFDAHSSLLTAQRLGLVPSNWEDDAVVSSHDLDMILKRLGADPEDMSASHGPLTTAEAARQISSHSAAIQALIASGSATSEFVTDEPSSSGTDEILTEDTRQVRNLSASEF